MADRPWVLPRCQRATKFPAYSHCWTGLNGTGTHLFFPSCPLQIKAGNGRAHATTRVLRHFTASHSPQTPDCLVKETPDELQKAWMTASSQFLCLFLMSESGRKRPMQEMYEGTCLHTTCPGQASSLQIPPDSRQNTNPWLTTDDIYDNRPSCPSYPQVQKTRPHSLIHQ